MKVKMLVIALVAMAGALLSPTAANAAYYEAHHYIQPNQTMLDGMGCSNVYYAVKFGNVSAKANSMYVVNAYVRNDSSYTWQGGWALQDSNGRSLAGFNGDVAPGTTRYVQIYTYSTAYIAVTWRYKLAAFGGWSACSSDPGHVTYQAYSWT